MKQTPILNLSQEEAERLASKPQTEVYTYEYDYHDPWPAERVLAAAERIRALAIKHDTEGGGEDAVKAAIKKDDELSLFASCHPVLAQKVGDASIAKDERKMDVVLKMIALHKRVMSNCVSSEDAKREVADMAMQVARQQ